MPSIQFALGAFAVLWAVQQYAGWRQMRRCQAVIQDATARRERGFLGVGHHRSRFGAAAVAIVEVDESLRVRRAMVMHGMSVFARFRPDDGAVGLTLSELETRGPAAWRRPVIALAIKNAIDKIKGVSAHA